MLTEVGRFSVDFAYAVKMHLCKYTNNEITEGGNENPKSLQLLQTIALLDCIDFLIL